jgi:glycosyltransferase involved in cell wall biosynthesis
MKLLYVTETLPWGRGESFFYPEIKALLQQGVEVKVLTTFPGNEFFHPHGRDLISILLDTDRRTGGIGGNLKCAFLFRSLRQLISGRGSIIERGKKAVKNTLLFRRADDSIASLQRWKPDHIHAQWANYTSTLAWMLSEALQVPWSFTAHRYDLLYDNLLLEKSKNAAFVRITSEQARDLAISRGLLSDSARTIVSYMGVEIPSARQTRPNGGRFSVAVPAALIERKGHLVLIRAVKRLDASILKTLRISFYGEGPEREKLINEIRRLSLESVIELKGALPHKELLEIYSNGLVDCVILPSLNFGNGLGEGIPFSLIEAMAYRVPVITTRTGGSPELLKDDSGILVSPGAEDELAEAIRLLGRDVLRRNTIASNGFTRVNSYFSVQKTTRDLISHVQATVRAI